MPRTEVRVFKRPPTDVPLEEWLDELERRIPKAWAKCVAVIQRLAELGNEIRMPHSKHLDDGIYELRTQHLGVNYRILFFFYSDAARRFACLTHGFTKEGEVPPIEIQRAATYRALVRANPDVYTKVFEF